MALINTKANAHPIRWTARIRVGHEIFSIYIQDSKWRVGGVTFGWSLYFACLEYFRCDL